MAVRIEVSPRISDARASVREKKLRELGFPVKVTGITDVYTINKNCSPEELNRAASALINPVIERSSVGQAIAPESFDWAVEIGFLPGVTDNVGSTTRETLEDLLKRKSTGRDDVYSSQVTYLSGLLAKDEVKRIAESLANPLIQRIHVKRAADFHRNHGMGTVVPMVELTQSLEADIVDLGVSDEVLTLLGKKGVPGYDAKGKKIRRGPLALDLPSMKVIQAYYRTLGRNPTDVELESIAQTWSEHCKHTIFAAQIDDIKEGLFEKYIRAATETIRNKLGANDFCRSVFTDNSGEIIFDGNWMVTHKVETHNSPSALDPYGGSITGIVGVNRDTFGFGIGAKPIINTYGFCFGYPEDQSVFYRQNIAADLTDPALSPACIMDGVIEGVRVGGNCSGIPTPQGFVYFDERYKCKPLVFVGTVGLIPKSINGKPTHEKKAEPKDLIVMVGGRVGLDGIHGATFSSEALDAGSPATAVQIGDPITQKKLCDVLIDEARQLGLYRSITDNGAGGLSCSVAEMARESNGCHVNLETVPTKYPGIAPWQIWISESQERMTLAVPPENIEPFMDLMKRRGVEASVIGEFTDDGKCVVDYNGKNVMDLDLKFLHDGLPQKKYTTTFTRGGEDTDWEIPQDQKLTGTLHDLLDRHNICSKEFISTQYDHEVQASSVLKPLVGEGRVNADATVTRPLLDSQRGIALSQGLFPSYSDIDTYNMAAASIDQAVRNIIAVGGSLDHLALLDNFCWCSSEEPERLGQLKRAAKACYDVATTYGTPFISGKDSMFNDFKGFDESGNPVKISVPPTLLVSSIGVIKDTSNCVSMDFKAVGESLYLIGETKKELGGSEYYAMMGEKLRGKKSTGHDVPEVNPEKNVPVYNALSQAIQKGIISSAHAIGMGGLGASLAKCAIAGHKGADISLQSRKDEAATLLFSESTGRFLVSVPRRHVKAFESTLETFPLELIGNTTCGDFTVSYNGKNIIETDVRTLEKHYKQRFAK